MHFIEYWIGPTTCIVNLPPQFFPNDRVHTLVPEMQFKTIDDAERHLHISNIIDKTVLNMAI